jgi:CRISPR-associated protein (TIGR03984 family)
MKNRTIEDCKEALTFVDVPANLDLYAWLVEQAGGATFWLLAHADDGVIWGKVENGTLTTAWDVTQGTNWPSVSPQLNLITLQTARLFNEKAELLLWRDDGYNWKARLIQSVEADQGASFCECLDEYHFLWGNRADAVTDTFTLLSDSGQGFHHIVPHATAKGSKLKVRYLIAEDKSGYKRIAANRLVCLEAKK